MAGTRGLETRNIMLIALLMVVIVVGGFAFVVTQMAVKPEPEVVECRLDSDCMTGYECFKSICIKIIKEKPICEGDVTPALDLLAYDKHSKAAITTSNVEVRREGGTTWTTYLSSSSSNVPLKPFEKVEIVYLGNSTGYYGYYIPEYEVECVEDPMLEVPLAQVATATSMSWTVWNKDGTVNAATNGQAIGTGSPVSMKMQIWGQYEDEMGSTSTLTDEDKHVCKGNILEVRVNKTVFEDTTSEDLESAWTPEQVSGDAANDTYYFFVPPIVSSSDAGSTGVFVMNFDPDDTTQPTVLHNFTMILYDCQYYLNDDSYEVEHSTEDYKGDDDLGVATELTKVIYTT